MLLLRLRGQLLREPTMPFIRVCRRFQRPQQQCIAYAACKARMQVCWKSYIVSVKRRRSINVLRLLLQVLMII